MNVWVSDVILNDKLSCTPNISAVAQSCRFALYNIHRIWSFFTKNAAQLLVQLLVISRLDYCNCLLAGLLASVTKPLQHIQNAAARLVYNLPKFSRVTHPPWPPLASCCGPHLIKDDGTGPQGRQQNCTRLPPNTGQIARPGKSISLIYVSWLTGIAIKQSTLSKVVTLLCFGTSVVKRTPDQCQDTLHLPQKTQDWFVQTSLRGLSWSPRPLWLNIV